MQASRPHSPRLHLPFLEGIRGAAALYVVLHHALNWQSETVPGAFIRIMRRLFVYGHEAVAVFIVLSGFCLMLPVACSQADAIPGGFLKYLRRRAQRILPPYYGALLVSLLVFSIPELRQPHHVMFDISLPPFEWQSLIAHLLMIHPFSPSWALKLNSPLWTVGLEWWIYFSLPAFLFVRQRLGTVLVIVLAILITAGPHLIGLKQLDYFCPWYAALFAFGGLTAASVVRADSGSKRYEKTRPIWLVGTLAAIGIPLFKHVLHDQLLVDLALAIGTCALIAACFIQTREGRRSPMLKIIESRAVLGIGRFSYSLYLIHWPVLALIWLALWKMHLSQVEIWWGMAVLGPLGSLAVAWLFYRCVESPLLPTRGPAVGPANPEVSLVGAR